MKVIDLSASRPTLAKLLELAGEENIVLKTPEGREFFLAEMDDFSGEISRTRQNKELMQLLDDRSRETATFTLSEVREDLAKEGKRKSRKGRNHRRK